jgi:hypothetical protein
MRRRSNMCALSQLVRLQVVTLVALSAPWFTKSEPLQSGSPSEPLSGASSLSSLSPEPGTLQSTNLTASLTAPSLVTTSEYYGHIQGILHSDYFIYMIDESGKVRRCGPTPDSGDCQVINHLGVTSWSGGPMAVLNSSHIIATSAFFMV